MVRSRARRALAAAVAAAGGEERDHACVDHLSRDRRPLERSWSPRFGEAGQMGRASQDCAGALGWPRIPRTAQYGLIAACEVESAPGSRERDGR